MSEPSLQNVDLARCPEEPWKRPTEPQKAELVASFPNLASDWDNVYVTDDNPDRITKYNCLAFALGICDEIIWPWQGRNATLEDFKTFFKERNYTSLSKKSKSRQVDAWGYTVGWMRHASRKRGNVWESKLGTGLRITHSEHALDGGMYGMVQGAYVPKKAGPFIDSHRLMSIDVFPLELTGEDRMFVRQMTADLDAERRAEFREAFADWRRTWFTGVLTFSSIPEDRAQGPEFDRLLSMGKEIIPLVVDQLQTKDNCLAAVLYDALSSATRERSETGSPIAEQARARDIVRSWIEAHRRN